MSLAANKVAVLQVARRQLALTDDDYRAVLFNIGGVRSSKELTDDAFDAVMFRLSQLGFKSDWNQRNFGYRADKATPRQVALIRHLWDQFTSGEGTDETLGKWMEAKFKISSVRFLRAADARKVIGALTAMNAKPKKRKAA